MDRPSRRRSFANMTRAASGCLTVSIACLVTVTGCRAFAASPAVGPLRVVTKPVALFVLPEFRAAVGVQCRPVERGGPPDGHGILVERSRRRERPGGGCAEGRGRRRHRGDRNDAGRREAGGLLPPLLRLRITDHGARSEREPTWSATLRSVPWFTLVQLLGSAILLFFVLANVLWLIERRSNPEFQKSYMGALGEALWERCSSSPRANTVTAMHPEC